MQILWEHVVPSCQASDLRAVLDALHGLRQHRRQRRFRGGRRRRGTGRWNARGRGRRGRRLHDGRGRDRGGELRASFVCATRCGMRECAGRLRLHDRVRHLRGRQDVRRRGAEQVRRQSVFAEDLRAARRILRTGLRRMHERTGLRLVHSARLLRRRRRGEPVWMHVHAGARHRRVLGQWLHHRFLRCRVGGLQCVGGGRLRGSGERGSVELRGVWERLCPVARHEQVRGRQLPGRRVRYGLGGLRLIVSSKRPG